MNFCEIRKIFYWFFNVERKTRVLEYPDVYGSSNFNKMYKIYHLFVLSRHGTPPMKALPRIKAEFVNFSALNFVPTKCAKRGKFTTTSSSILRTLKFWKYFWILRSLKFWKYFFNKFEDIDSHPFGHSAKCLLPLEGAIHLKIGISNKKMYFHLQIQIFIGIVKAVDENQIFEYFLLSAQLSLNIFVKSIGICHQKANCVICKLNV